MVVGEAQGAIWNFTEGTTNSLAMALQGQDISV